MVFPIVCQWGDTEITYRYGNHSVSKVRHATAGHVNKTRIEKSLFVLIIYSQKNIPDKRTRGGGRPMRHPESLAFSLSACQIWASVFQR